MSKIKGLIVFSLVSLLFFTNITLAFAYEDNDSMLRVVSFINITLQFDFIILLFLYLSWKLYEKTYKESYKAIYLLGVLFIFWSIDMYHFFNTESVGFTFQSAVVLYQTGYSLIRSIVIIIAIAVPIHLAYKQNNKKPVIYSSLLYVTYLVLEQFLNLTGLYYNDSIILFFQIMIVFAHVGLAFTLLVATYLSIHTIDNR